MKNKGELPLDIRIDRFISRKAEEFPELGLLKRGKYNDTAPRRKYFGDSLRKAM